jgi:sulfide dehydrogenase cytochrome subunit
MSCRITIKSMLTVFGLALTATSFAAPSASMLVYPCAGCHGTNGVSAGPAIPTIAGISHDYFIDAMKDYRDGDRPATVMGRIAKGYTDEEIKKMAEFFSKEEFVPHKQSYDVKTAKRGYILHRKYCDKCHQDGGRSKEDDAGILAGQWQPYLRYQLEDFRSGDRLAPKKMKKRIHYVEKKVGDKAFDQLLNYWASQDDRK